MHVPIWVPLDVPNAGEALVLVKKLISANNRFKVGKELFTAVGPQIIEDIRRMGGRVFLDLKYHDIPNTVAGAVTAAAAHEVDMLNVHVSGGRKMMEAAMNAVNKVVVNRPLVIGVTLLTSLKEDDLKEIGLVKHNKFEKAVVELAKLAKGCGLDGVVASPNEASAIREACGPGFLIVTPGIREASAPPDDQARTATAYEAVLWGANQLVIGRPIIKAEDPKAAVEKFQTAGEEAQAELAQRT